jgi:quercetin dioxygenase-like cupin family protein
MEPGGKGFRVSLMTYPPGWKGEMFWSNRVDLIWILSGELTYVTDGGDEVVLRPGDVVIQNGTNKAFMNRGSEPVWFGAVCCGAIRVGPTPPPEQFHGTQETLRQHLEVGARRAMKSSTRSAQ